MRHIISCSVITDHKGHLYKIGVESDHHEHRYKKEVESDEPVPIAYLRQLQESICAVRMLNSLRRVSVRSVTSLSVWHA